MAGTGATTTTCAICELGLDHCHGLLVEHPDGAHECEEGCGGGLALHDEVVTCAELTRGCCPTVVLDDPAGGDKRSAPLAPAA